MLKITTNGFSVPNRDTITSTGLIISKEVQQKMYFDLIGSEMDLFGNKVRVIGMKITDENIFVYTENISYTL